ncbi:MAG TPA: hypothetical protein VGH44_02100 [Candidatus Saccharimonadia bacterium]|jgi:hypothetical protein
MDVERHEYRHGFTVPDLDELKLVLARAAVGRVNWDSVNLKDGRITLSELKSHAELHEMLQAHIDEVLGAIESALDSGDYWSQSYDAPFDWMPTVRRLNGVYHVSTTDYVCVMDDLAAYYGQQQQSLRALWLEAQFPLPASARAGEIVELDLRPVVQALHGTRLSRFTAAQLATTICGGFLYPGETRSHRGGKVPMFLDSLACVVLDVNDDTVGSFHSGWHQKEGEPWTMLVSLKRDTSTYAKELAGTVHAPAFRFTVVGSVNPEILDLSPIFGAGGYAGLPIVGSEHEDYVLTIAADLERRLRAINL